MIDQYGSKKAEQVFIDKAKEQGTGSTVRQKANSVYKTGAKLT